MTRKRVVTTCSALAALAFAACSISTSTVLEPGAAAGDPEGLAERARVAWDVEPRTAASVQEAFGTMVAAVRASEPGDPARFDRIADAARYAIWLARDSTIEEGAFADSALVLSNTAVEADSTRVEGFHYRSIAAGLIARTDQLRGRSAMRRIRDDARRAIEIDPDFDEAGPHRVLGALFLRAPGPPAGLGSLPRALLHLEEARARAPGEPQNLLYLAEAYLKADRVDEAAALVEEAEARLAGSAEDDRRWAQLAEMKARLAGRGEGGPPRGSLPG